MHAHFIDEQIRRRRPLPQRRVDHGVETIAVGSEHSTAHRLAPDIEQQGVRIHLAPDDILFFEGSPAKFLYRVEWGELQLFRKLPAMNRQRIATRSGGDYCLCNMGDVYAVSCAALSHAEVTRFPRTRAQTLGMGSQDTQWALRAAARNEVKHFALAPVARRSVAGTIAATLLRFDYSSNGHDKAYEYTVPVPIPNLAAMLDISDDDVRRVLAILSHWDMIDVNGYGEIVVTDVDSLKKLEARLSKSV